MTPEQQDIDELRTKVSTLENKVRDLTLNTTRLSSMDVGLQDEIAKLRRYVEGM